MPRPFARSFAVFAFAVFGCAPPPDDAPPVQTATKVARADNAPAERPLTATPLQQLPDEPSEKDLTNNDLGLDPKIEAALPEIERPDLTTVDGRVTNDAIGSPNVPERAQDKEEPKAGSGGFLGRTGATKARLVKEGGGNADSERAVALGLAWLAKQQQKDGGWVFDAGSKEETAAATGLALLPFLGAGETHKTSMKYKATVNAGVQWLVKDMAPNGANAGKFAGTKTFYGQGIATLALVEAYALTKDPALKPAAQAAINYIQKSQAENGSWGYTAGTKGDTSIVGWQIQALKAAQLCKELKVDEKVLKKAVAFLDLTAGGARKSVYGYTDNTGAAPGTALTAIGLLCRYYIAEWSPVHPGLIDGITGLMKNAPPSSGQLKNMYYFYYATQIVHFFEGEEWKTWNEGAKQPDGTRKGGVRDWLVGAQNKKDDANKGSWDPEQGWFGTQCGRLGTTAVSLLTLEVYYRYLPLYKPADDKPIDDK